MHQVRLLWIFVGFFSFAISGLSQHKESLQKPNIIFILTDDQRFDAIGYVGNPYVQTPEMDQLARLGAYFHNAVVTTPICAASRASILTGLYERAHNYNFQTGNIRTEYMDKSYPILLRTNGYHTGFFGKYGVRYDGLEKQFDTFESYDRNTKYNDKRGYYYKTIGKDTVHLTRYTGQQAIDFIEEAPDDKPFCLSLSFSAPHAHDSAPDQYFWQLSTDSLLSNTVIPGPELGEDQFFDALPMEVRKGFNRTRWNWRFDTPEKYQHSLKGYYRMISGIDLEIGKIRKKLKEKGLEQNTVIILMGDNGYFLGERQLAGKWLMYDPSIRVPLIIYDPRVNQHHDIQEMAVNVDIPSTIIDLAGLDVPSSWHGKSLLSLVRNEIKSFDRDTILIEHIWEFDDIPPSEGIRTRDWKYFRYVNDKSIEELYNLKNDPKEINNLILDSNYNYIADKLRTKCNELIKLRSNQFRNAPYDLSVELIREPGSEVAVVDIMPEFGWTVPLESKFQSAFQILVSSSKESIEKNIGNVWDSKQIRSSQSTNVEYNGDPLHPSKTYYWKVRIWDEENRLVDYSKPQMFKVEVPIDFMISSENKYITSKIKPVKFEDKGDFYFVDFGKDAFSTLEINYHATTPHTLIVRIGEQLEGENINRKPMSTSHIRYQEIKVEVEPGKKVYQLPIKPDFRNTLPGKALPLPEGFPVLMPFRYAEIEGALENISSEDITQLAFHTYWDNDASYFHSDNDILNQVWDLCKYSIKATTFNGLYVDGDRERIPYEADAYLNQLSHYATDREYAMARRTIEYFMKNPTWPTEWQQHVALLIYADYMYTGNIELVERYYEKLKYKTLFELSDDRGLISTEKVTHEFMLKLGFQEDYEKTLSDIVDWPSAGWGGDANNKGERDGYVFKPYNTVVNAFFYENMKIMAVFAKILGKPEEALEFELRTMKVKKALNEWMFDKERGIYIDGIGTDHASLHANMIPLAFGMVPEEYFETVLSFIKSRGMACSVYGSQYLMDALYNAGEADYALQLLTSTDQRSWYNMISAGSTITLEAWDIKFKNNLDWNHAWGAVPANIIPRRMWGIMPKTPGFGVATIHPQMSNLKSSTITVPTVRGPIKANYSDINPGLKTYEIEIPGNMIGEFSLHEMEGKNILHNGKKVPLTYEFIHLEPGKHNIEVKINSF